MTLSRTLTPAYFVYVQRYSKSNMEWSESGSGAISDQSDPVVVHGERISIATDYLLLRRTGKKRITCMD